MHPRDGKCLNVSVYASRVRTNKRGISPILRSGRAGRRPSAILPDERPVASAPTDQNLSQAGRIHSVWVPATLSAATLGYAAYAAAWPSSQIWGPSLARLPRGANEIALTFDDGPSNETPRFLDALEAMQVRATFFVCGRNVERRPSVARSIVSAGHSIGNHTYSHPLLAWRSYSRVRDELRRAQAAIGEATGVQATLFRPPYGLRSPALRRLLPELGLTGIHWSVIGNDWKWDARRIARHVLRRTGDGAIICLHDGQGTDPTSDRAQTLAAVREIVPQLRDLGFRFVPLRGGGSDESLPSATGNPGPVPTGQSSRRR